MKNMYLKKWMVAATLLLAVGGYAQNSKLVLVKGKKYEVTTTAKVNSVASVMGQEMESTADNLTVETFEVKDSRAVEADIVATVTRLAVKASAMGQETEFDSDKKDNSGPAAEELGKQVNKPKNYTVSTSGKILKQDKSETSAGMMMMGFGTGGDNISLFRESLIGRNFTNGSTWADSLTNNTDKIKTTLAGIYTVKSIENNIATVAFNGTTTVNGTMEQMGQEMEMTSTSKVTGEAKIDIATGILLENSTKSDGTMNIEAGGMSIPVTVKTTTIVKTKAL